MMSLAATIFFKTGLSVQILPVWLGTTALNMPAALIWQLFEAGPLVRFIFGKAVMN